MLQGSVNKVDSLNSASGLYSFNSKGSSFIHSLVTFFYSGIGAAAIPARLRLRKNFGERAFSPAAVIVSVSFYIYIVSRIFFIFADEKDESDDFIFSLISFVFLLLPFNSFSYSIYKTLKLSYNHFKKIYYNSEMAGYKYSYFRGEPITEKYLEKIGKRIFGYTVDEKIIRIFYEPKGFAINNLIKGVVAFVITCVLGFFVFSLNSYSIIYDWKANILPIALCFWLITFSISSLLLSFSGFCLLLEELSITKKIRDNVLDMIDGEYDMQFLIKQKETLTIKDSATSIDIAEEIYQNPEYVELASLPVFAIETDIEVAHRENQIITDDDVDKSLAEMDVAIAEADAILEELEKSDEEEKKNLVNTPTNTPTHKSNQSTEKEWTWGNTFTTIFIVLIVLSWVYSYSKYGLVLFKTYTPNVEADIAPNGSKFILKNITADIDKTTLTFEVSNEGQDTLYFPFIQRNDARSIQINAHKTYEYIIKEKLGFSREDSMMAIGLKEKQNFTGAIVVPPNESQTYNLEFSKFEFSTMRKFSIISRDKVLNKTYLYFADIDLR